MLYEANYSLHCLSGIKKTMKMYLLVWFSVGLHYLWKERSLQTDKQRWLVIHVDFFLMAASTLFPQNKFSSDFFYSNTGSDVVLIWTIFIRKVWWDTDNPEDHVMVPTLCTFALGALPCLLPFLAHYQVEALKLSEQENRWNLWSWWEES